MTRKYRCPGCGKNVKFGSHFCSGEPEPRLDDPFPEHRESPRFQTLKRAGIIFVASALILTLLWSFLGFYAYILIAIVTIIIAAMLLLKRNGIHGENGAGTPGYRELTRLLGGDRESAERLIEAEMERYPDFNRSECIRRVYDKLVYDRSR